MLKELKVVPLGYIGKRYLERDIRGSGRGQSQADQVCHGSLHLILEVTRANSEWVIPTCLAWVIGLIFGCINKIRNTADWSGQQNLSTRHLITEVGMAIRFLHLLAWYLSLGSSKV